MVDGTDIEIFTAVADAAALAAALRDPPAHGASVLKENRKRTVFRLRLGELALIVKHHRGSGAIAKVAPRTVARRARREIEIAQRLLAAGIRTPQPVAYAFEASARRAIVATQEIVDAVPLGTFLETRFQPGDGKSREKRAAFLPAIDLLSRIHSAGLDHRDFHGGNLLVAPGGELFVIDLHRVATRAPSPRRRLRALADLVHTLRFALDSADDAIALHRYCELDRSLAYDAPTLAALRRTIERRERERIQSRSKRCLKESSSFTRIAAGGCRGFRRREIETLELFAAIADARVQIETGGARARSLAAKSAVAIGETASRRYAVKIYQKDGFERSLRGRVHSRARRAYRLGHALHVRGVPVPAVLAFVHTPDRGILVSEEIDGAQPLHVAAHRLAQRGEEAALLSTALAVGDLVISFVRGRVSINDLSAKNVLVRVAPSGAEAFFCDFDGVKLRRPDRALLIRALGQLNDLAPQLGARIRLRVLLRVKRAVPELRGGGVAAAIALETARRQSKRLGVRPPLAIAPLSGGETLAS